MADSQFEMRVAPEDEGGVYSNVVAVWHTPHEFTLDFGAMLPTEQRQGPAGEPITVVPARVTARVKVPPSVIFELIKAINGNMTQYEQQFGPIKQPGSPQQMFPPDDQGET